jgi:drug/metabolite transporter (DMT)-like permease
VIYLLLAVVFYSLAVLIGASASRNANTNLVSFINTLFSAIIPFFVVLPVLSKKAVTNQRYGLAMAALGGVVISIFVLLLSKSFTQNKIGIITPVVYGGTIFLSTIASYFIFKEKISLLEGTGLTIVLLGLIIIIYARATA